MPLGPVNLFHWGSQRQSWFPHSFPSPSTLTLAPTLARSLLTISPPYNELNAMAKITLLGLQDQGPGVRRKRLHHGGLSEHPANHPASTLPVSEGVWKVLTFGRFQGCLNSFCC